MVKWNQDEVDAAFELVTQALKRFTLAAARFDYVELVYASLELDAARRLFAEVTRG